MKINFKQVAADIVSVGAVISAILAVLLNVAHAVSLPAPDVAFIVGASSVVAAIVNAVRPYAAKAAKAILKR